MGKRLIILPEELEIVVNRLTEIERTLRSENRGLEDPILDTDGVMRLLKVSRRSLQTWRDQGLIEFSAIHGKFYYRMSSINKMLDAHLQTQEVHYGN
jgi:hypothetical protein